MPYFTDREVRIDDIMVQHAAISGSINNDKDNRYGIVIEVIDGPEVRVRIKSGEEQIWIQSGNCYNLTARVESMNAKAARMAAKETRLRIAIDGDETPDIAQSEEESVSIT